MERERKRIETKTSRTAEFTCMYRAASYVETRECYKGDDTIAYILVPGFIKLILRFPRICHLYHRFLGPKGIYEYVVARTNYIDAVFKDVLEKGFGQIVIFGAGFDSRAQRFDHLNRSTRIFELDAPITQEEKLEAFKEKNIMIPENLVYVPINFNRERLPEKLTEAGFEEGRKSLFLLEGVTMYLSHAAIESTFGYIRNVSGRGSLIVFDYIYAGVLRQEHRYYGERNTVRTVLKAGEGWSFALEEGEIEDFLGTYGFSIKDHSSAQELEERYFKNREGEIVGRINATHSLATAAKE